MATIVATSTADHVAGIDPEFARTSDRVTQLAFLAAQKALGDATGMVFGMDYGIYPTVAACLHRMRTEGYRATSPQEFALATPNIPHSQICIRLGLKGLNTNVSCGSLSSLVAISLAADFISWGRADTLLAGGASSVAPPLPEFVGATLTERAAFVRLSRTGDGPVIAKSVHRRLKDGSMEPLIREISTDIDCAIVHPGSSDSVDGLPDVPVHDIRDLSGETLDAAGAMAVVEAADRISKGARGVLIAFRDLSGRDGAAMVLQR